MIAVDEGDAEILTIVADVGPQLVDLALFLEVHAAVADRMRGHGFTGEVLDRAIMEVLPLWLAAALARREADILGCMIEGEGVTRH